MHHKQTIRVGGVPEHFNLPWHLALDQDRFADLSCDVKYLEFPGGTGAMTSAMDAGELDVALLLFEGAVTNILRGHRNRIVKVYVQSPLTWGIHVAANSSIQTIDEIRDKVYATSRAGSGSHLIAIVDAAERGWPTGNMKFSKVDDLQGARESLASGKVDVFLWELFTTQPLVDSGEFRRVGQRVVPWPAFVVSVRQECLSHFATDLHALLKTVQDCCRQFSNDPQSPKMVSEKFGIKPRDANQWFEQIQWSFDFQRPDATIEKLIRYLNNVGIIDAPAAVAGDVWFRLPIEHQQSGV